MKPGQRVPLWIPVVLGVSAICMVAAATVIVTARFSASPVPPAEETPTSGADIEESALKEIDQGLADSARLLGDIRRQEQELRARLALSQAVPAARVAAIQFASTFGDVAGNRERLIPLIRLAAQAGARLIVMPECAIPGYMSVDHRTAWRDP
ncbi:MAG TPA: nitrilase-related carbon-nitrogen hydrolase, partial [bacterium]|nr:nitrilase-related carbon-nitrogen hydrolase [bacterium]